MLAEQSKKLVLFPAADNQRMAQDGAMEPLRLASLWSRVLAGAKAIPVAVEVHLGNGLPQFQLVGLADTEVRESRDRVRVALQACGFQFPQRRITVNLAPADLPKRAGHFDLPLALGLLIASGQLPAERSSQFEFAAELALDGRLRPVRGTLAMAQAAGHGPRQLIVSAESRDELAPFALGNTLLASTLGDVVSVLRGEHRLHSAAHRPLPTHSVPADTPDAAPDGPSATADHLHTPDLADVRGQAVACAAMVTAAAGGHAILLLGPPGCGKTLLASRLHGLLPPLSADEALTCAIQRTLGGQPVNPATCRIRPWRRPHHSTTLTALTGGGQPLQPGEMSLAHAGVLMLDEVAEFPRACLEALREPLDNGEIYLARSHGKDVLPARFQLVATMNHCPCGRERSDHPPCRCTQAVIDRYRAHLSAPLLDRIDLWVQMHRTTRAVLKSPPGESSAAARQRVTQARQVQWQRQTALNAHLPLPQLREVARLSQAVCAVWQDATQQHRLSGRGAQRLLAVARTLADLDGCTSVQATHVYQAAGWRRAF